MYFDNKDGFLQPKVSQYDGHMVMTNVHKEIKAKHVNFDTKFRDDYQEYSKTTPTQYTMTMPTSITGVKSIELISAEIPMSFFNISNSLGNNVMRITDTSSGTAYVIVLRDGTYTSSSLKTEINAQLTSLSVTGLVFDVSGNATTSTTIDNAYSSFVLTSAKTYTIDFAVKLDNMCSGILNAPGTITATFDRYNVKSKLGWLLGFRNITYTITGATGRLYSENVIDLSNPRYLYLVVDEFSSSNPNSFMSLLPASFVSKNILAKFQLDYKTYPLGVNAFLPCSQYSGNLQSDIRTYNGPTDLQRLKVQLVNEYGAHINLNGSDFSFCLKIQYS